MEFPQGRRDAKYLMEEEEEEEEEEVERKQRVAGGQQAFPLSSSPILLHWADGSSEPSTSAPPPPAPPAAAAVEKEHMFEKVVTPSDVGKLNRLVIPKQHAEKYFPLDASSNDKGLLLNFEDRTGKPWRFRYSYWNSSQSYVMTKGWSRFVKEKQLDAGDTVSFARGLPDHARDRLFIDCKRRPDPRFDPNPPASLRIPRFAYHPYPFSAAAARSSANSWGPASRLFAPHPPATVTPASNYFYFRSPATHPDRAPPVPMVLDSFPVAHGKAAAAPKRLRLFGVNLEQACDAGDAADTSSLLLLHRRQPLPSPELRLGGNGGNGGNGAGRSSSSSSSSREWKDGHHSPPLDLDMC